MPNLKSILMVVALFSCALTFVSPTRVAAARQERGRASVSYDAARLRGALRAALGGEFEIVRDRLVRRSDYHGGGAYWLAHVRPRRAGHFTLKYTYKYDDPFNRQDPLYTHVEHDLSFAVGPRGCRREPEHNTSSFRPCLGDTVILPVVLDAYKRVYTEHTFKFTVNSLDAPREPERAEASAAAPSKAEAVVNPLAEHLKYVGRSVHVSPHRARGFTADYYVTFEAVKPGRFNLLVTGRHSASAPPAPSSLSEAKNGSGSIPVIIVARGAPVTWLAARESVRAYSERFASNSGNSYLTSPVIMQPGERVTLRYAGFSRRGLRATEREPSEEELDGLFVPVIARHPFRVERESQFNEWIVEHLPR